MRTIQIFAVLTVLLFALPMVSLANGSGEAVARVYVYDIPDITVSLTSSEDTLICSWEIDDMDKDEQFAAEVLWTRNDDPFAAETINCGNLRSCAALERPEPQFGETWKCLVTVTDSFDAVGEGSAEFYQVPLGFFGGIFQAVFSFFNLS